MDKNIYEAPQSELSGDDNAQYEYVGFWMRVVACLVDTLLVLLIIAPILYAVYGEDYFDSQALIQGGVDFLLSYIFPAVAVMLFWIYRSATPGKLAIHAKIIDAKTGGKPTTSQFFIRYIGYFVSTFPLMLGLIWVGFDGRKQGWHDKIAGTLVVKSN